MLRTLFQNAVYQTMHQSKKKIKKKSTNIQALTCSIDEQDMLIDHHKTIVSIPHNQTRKDIPTNCVTLLTIFVGLT